MDFWILPLDTFQNKSDSSSEARLGSPCTGAHMQLLRGLSQPCSSVQQKKHRGMEKAITFPLACHVQQVCHNLLSRRVKDNSLSVISEGDNIMMDSHKNFRSSFFLNVLR